MADMVHNRISKKK